MRDGQACSQHRATNSIEQEYAARGIIVQRACQPPADLVTEPSAAEPLAFQVQKRDLVQCIAGPQTGIELETVDDGIGRRQPDVLRSQVAVTIDDEPSRDPFDECSSISFEKPPLNGRNTRDRAMRQAEASFQESSPIEDGGFAERSQVSLWLDQ
ncbi:hypothetical protein, partial [Bradyrhizobium guangdongense]|uniref:hypothetical protein n=1 Tax=Bradyrhizobium guangdongense TaxID=1325090 RepID=UPI001AEC7445